MNPWLRVFAPFAAGYFLSYFLRNVNAVIAPELMRELGASATDLGLLTAAYLLGFGLFQLPLGILLDRYGPRRVEAGLLLVAAGGAALFASGGNLAELAGARALIGLGVSACLMASFKAFSLWFEPARQASLNAAVMAAGGLGALSATSPLSAALPLIGWRGVFFGLAALSLLAAVGIFSTPEKTAGAAETAGATGETLRGQVAALAGILKSRVFWRFAPQTALIVGGFMAVQGLWAVPWLMTVNGFSRDAAAFHLLLTSGAMLAGFLLIAFFVRPLAQRGVPPIRLLQAGMGLGLLLLLLIVLDVADPAAGHLLWFGLGLVFAVGNLAYALLGENFPLHVSGRANTALNLAAFVGAFGVQWGLGALIDAFVRLGLALPAAYRLAFAALLTAQLAAWLWFVWGGRKSDRT